MKPDGPPDNRITCATCKNAKLHATGNFCMRLRIGITVKVPLRCVSYMPDHIERDQTPGKERWPGLRAELAAARSEAVVPELSAKAYQSTDDMDAAEAYANAQR